MFRNNYSYNFRILSYKKIMKKNFIILILFLLTSCQSAEEILTNQKKSNTDEFLVEKKNPLVLPPDYNKLPTPLDKENVEDDDIDLSSSLKEIKDSASNSENISQDTSLEEKILKKIK